MRDRDVRRICSIVRQMVAALEPADSAALGRQVDALSVGDVSGGYAQLTVPPGVAASGLPDGPVVVNAVVTDEDDNDVGELLLWIATGYLDLLEYAWWTEDPPQNFPDVARINVSRSD